MSRIEARWNWQPAYAARGDARVALKRAADACLARSNAQVPVASGELLRSGKVTMEEARACISYSRPYAVIVHERLDVRHPRGHAKFLEMAALEAQQTLERDIAKGIHL